jgi:signal transduction histidine kinase
VDNYDRIETQVTGDAGRALPRGTCARQLAEAIESRRAEIGASWWKATRTGAEPPPDGDRDGDPLGSQGETLVCAVATALRASRRWHDTVMRAGWTFGVTGHTRRVPLYFLLEDLDLLGGVVLDVAREHAGRGRLGDADADETLALARRAHEAVSLMRLSAVKGYTQSVSEELQRRFRVLRHDLRNPLGTIKSALALMEDETIPAEMRASPRFRAMARKNASSMEALIRTTLGDSAALLPAFAHEPVSLRSVAAAVRRDLRHEAETRQVRIVVGDRLPTVRTDSAGFELTLKSVVAAVMRDVGSPAEVVIDLATLSDRMASVRVSVVPEDDSRPPLDAEDLAFARELAARSGGQIGRVGPGRLVCLEVPVSVGEQPNDVGGPRERHHR